MDEHQPGNPAMMEVVPRRGKMVHGLLILMMVVAPPMAEVIVHQLGLQVLRPQLMARPMLSVLAQKLPATLVTTPGARKLQPTSHNHNQTITVVGDNKHLKITAGVQMHTTPRLLARPFLPQHLLL